MRRRDWVMLCLMVAFMALSTVSGDRGWRLVALRISLLTLVAFAFSAFYAALRKR